MNIAPLTDNETGNCNSATRERKCLGRQRMGCQTVSRLDKGESGTGGGGGIKIGIEWS